MPGPPGGRLARLSRERARPGAMIALSDGCSGATVVLPHHAAGSWPMQLVGLIVEHLTSMCCGPHSTSTWDSLCRSPCRCSVACGLKTGARAAGCAGSTERPVFEWRGAWQGLPWLLGQRPVSVAWFGTLLRVSVRECERPFRKYVPYVRSRDDLK
jgi:hypothetical protein